MNHLRKIIAILMAIGLLPALYAAGNNQVAIVYGETNQTNRHTINFIYQNVRGSGQGWNFKLVQNPADIMPGQYHRIIVVSTAVRNGVEPKLLSFINSYSAKSELILVSLLSGGELTVAQVPAAQSSLGVDTVAAATAWGKRGRSGNKNLTAPKGVSLTSYNSAMQMHDAWVQDLQDLLAR